MQGPHSSTNKESLLLPELEVFPGAGFCWMLPSAINAEHFLSYYMQKKRSIFRVKNLLLITGSLLILFFTYRMLLITIPYLSFDRDVDFLRTKLHIIHLDHYRLAFYLHIFTSSFVLLIGAIQFSGFIMRRLKMLHKWAGRFYVFILLFVSAPSGLVMGYYANGGISVQVSFFLLTPLWMIFTGLAWYYARKRQVLRHGDFMVRSYALTLSAITLRLYSIIFSKYIHIGSIETYIAISWLSWIPNLIIAEILILVGISKRLLKV